MNEKLVSAAPRFAMEGIRNITQRRSWEELVDENQALHARIAELEARIKAISAPNAGQGYQPIGSNDPHAVPPKER